MHGYELFLYIVPDNNVNVNSSVTIQCLHRSFQKLRERLGTDMPRSWQVQADSASDNKCKYVFAYFAHCVGVGAATDVEVYFLMVGHTHEDIDALFSVIADRLRQRDGTARAVTTEDLKHIIEDAFTQEKMVRAYGRICGLSDVQSGMHM